MIEIVIARCRRRRRRIYKRERFVGRAKPPSAHVANTRFTPEN